MTVVISQNPACTRYRQLLDRTLAAGHRVPTGVHQLALAGQYTDAIEWLQRIDGSTSTWGEGRFAAEVKPLTAKAAVQMCNRALANLAAEVRDAGPEELAHFARMAEALCSTDLGARMRNLVDDARTRRVFTFALLPGGEGSAGLGWDEEADRQDRWEQDGKVGHWSDPEYDVPDPRVRPGGEGGAE